MTLDTATKTRTNSATVKDEATLHTNGQQPNDGTDDLLVALEKSAYAQDGYTFLDLIEGVDWSARPVEHILKAIDMALLVGASRLAMKLAQESVRLFPDDPRCQWSARVIAPARVVGTSPASGRNRSATYAWLRRNAKHYRKQWVGVRDDGTLVASAPSYPALKVLLKDEEDPGGILVTRVL